MQSEKITLIPPTHEQTLFTFHVEASIAKSFIKHLEKSGLEAWRPIKEQDKEGPDGLHVIQIEVDTDVTEDRLRDIMDQFEA